jgi:hypothetical protein
MPLFCFEHYFMIVKELFGTQIINASFLFANSNISVKYYSKNFPSVHFLAIIIKTFKASLLGANKLFLTNYSCSYRQ